MKQKTSNCLALLLVTLCAFPDWTSAGGTKGNIQMSNTESDTQMQVDDLIYGGRSLNPLAKKNQGLPILNPIGNGTYADVAHSNLFYAGRMQDDTLVYLETWERALEHIPMDTPMEGDRVLADIAPVAVSSDPNATYPVFLMRPAPDEPWAQVNVDQTQGETTFVRVHLVKSLRSDVIEPIAALVDQKLMQRTRFEYDADGNETRRIVQRRETDFEDEVIVAPDLSKN